MTENRQTAGAGHATLEGLAIAALWRSLHDSDALLDRPNVGWIRATETERAFSHAPTTPRRRTTIRAGGEWSLKVVMQPLVTTLRERATSNSANLIETRDPTLKRARSTTATGHGGCGTHARDRRLVS